jgi:hypothetical protein
MTLTSKAMKLMTAWLAAAILLVASAALAGNTGKPVTLGGLAADDTPICPMVEFGYQMAGPFKSAAEAEWYAGELARAGYSTHVEDRGSAWWVKYWM